MAWTRSAQRRGNFAFLPTAADRANALRQLEKYHADVIRRGGFAAAAAALTLFGLAAPSLASETIATTLFLAGAAVALLALRPPYPAKPDDRSASDVRSPPAAPAGRRTAFPELLVGVTDSHAALDRAAWARLTAHMSHQLRTPLNAVLGFSELMSNETFGPLGASCYSAYARDIHSSGRLLLKSAEDALAITALLAAPAQRSCRTSISLASALDDAASFHTHAIEQRRVAVKRDAVAAEDVVCDPQTARQILINMIAEALDRALPGATLSIATRRLPGQIALEIVVRRASAAGDDASFSLQLASTLAELSGARLSVTTTEEATTFAVAFTPALQSDFFN